jgi:malic enzyme
MHPPTVEKLEAKLAQAIADVFDKLDSKRRPIVPSVRTLHLMAKAAVTVYEAAVENGLAED